MKWWQRDALLLLVAGAPWVVAVWYDVDLWVYAVVAAWWVGVLIVMLFLP